MSVVNLITHDSFALIMGDTKLNDNPNVDHITKVFKKDNILLGYTGKLQDIKEYLYPIFTDDMQLDHNYLWGNTNEPIEFFKYLDNKFYDALKENRKYDVVFVVATKIGEKYIAKHYCLCAPSQPFWKADTIISSDEFQCTYLGNKVHCDFFVNSFATNQISSYQDIIKIFQDTLDYGINYDNTINNEMEWFIL